MTWLKGQSGNPSGRPKIASHIRDLAKEDAEEMYEILANLARHAKEDGTKAGCAKEILKLAGVSSEPEKETATYRVNPAANTSTADLVALVRAENGDA